MAKRFTDTEKWGKAWFYDLAPMEKLIWLYILDSCDHAGIWYGAFGRLASDLKTSFSTADFERTFSKQILKIGEGKYFIPSFVEFQYKLENFTDLKPENRAHAAVIAVLRKYGLWNSSQPAPRIQAPYETLQAPCEVSQAPYGVLQGSKDKEQEKEKDKVKEQETDTDTESARGLVTLAGTIPPEPSESEYRAKARRMVADLRASAAVGGFA